MAVRLHACVRFFRAMLFYSFVSFINLNILVYVYMERHGGFFNKLNASRLYEPEKERKC